MNNSQEQCPIIADDQMSGCDELVDADLKCPVHGDVSAALGRYEDTGYGTVESYHRAELARLRGDEHSYAEVG